MTSPVRAPRPTPRRIAQPVAAPAPRAHLRVVPPPGRPSIRGRRTGAVLAVAMVLVFGSLMASAIFHGLLVSGQADLDRMETQIQEQKSGLAQDKLELADLQSPARIASEAAKLGMVPAERQHWLSPGTGADPVVTGGPATDPASDSTTDPTTDTDTTGQSADELAATGGGATGQ